MASFGLNEHHHSTIVNYMRFARYQRGQRLKAVDASFKEMKDSRLTEDTFTLDEVTEMLDSLHSIVRGDVEMELINTSHTNVLLLMQLFEQAEKWHLKLQADVSSLENRELLEQIRDFEEEQFSGRKGDSKSSGRLQPLNEGGGATLLNMEIERLNEENKKLQDRLKQVESVAVAAQKEKAAIKAELDHMDNELKRFRKSGMSDGEVADLRAQMENLKVNMDKNMSINRDEKFQLESDLSGMKHEVLRIREMLEMAEKELEKKVSNTAPYINLKQMMQKKNEQMKDLRKRLSKYEKVTDD